MEINGSTFFDVQLSHNVMNASEIGDTYTAKGVGIIKKVVHSGIARGEWNLIRSKIVKQN